MPPPRRRRGTAPSLRSLFLVYLFASRDVLGFLSPVPLARRGVSSRTSCTTMSTPSRRTATRAEMSSDSAVLPRKRLPPDLATTDPDVLLSDEIQAMLCLERLRLDLQERLGRLDVSAEEVAAAADMTPDAYETAVRRGNRARSLLVVKNLPLVANTAQRYARRGGVPFEDLMQEGSIGLMTAATRFDGRRGYRFSTYATYWIRQAVWVALARQGRQFALPQSFHSWGAALRQAEAALREVLGREPTEAEAAAAAKLTAAQARLIRSEAARPALSMSMQTDGRRDTLGDGIAASGATVEEIVDENVLRETLTALLDSLPPKQGAVLRLRFGLGALMSTAATASAATAIAVPAAVTAKVVPEAAAANAANVDAGSPSADLATTAAAAADLASAGSIVEAAMQTGKTGPGPGRPAVSLNSLVGGGGRGLSIAATAEALGCSLAYVRELEAKGVAGLRRALAENYPDLWQELLRENVAAASAARTGGSIGAANAGVGAGAGDVSSGGAMRDGGAGKGGDAGGRLLGVVEPADVGARGEKNRESYIAKDVSGASDVNGIDCINGAGGDRDWRFSLSSGRLMGAGYDEDWFDAEDGSVVDVDGPDSGLDLEAATALAVTAGPAKSRKKDGPRAPPPPPLALPLARGEAPRRQPRH